MKQQELKGISWHGTICPSRWKRVWPLAIAFVFLTVFWLQPRLLAQNTAYSGDSAGAERLLHRFLEPDADYRALTLMLRPRSEDYQAVYQQPLADLLEKAHQPMWEDEASAIMPKQGQTDIMLELTTTEKLIERERQLEEFPGGYKDVLDFMNPGIPIGRFKFVVPGEKHGMSFDGLVYVNERWVFIPKPWRVLP